MEDACKEKSRFFAHLMDGEKMDVEARMDIKLSEIPEISYILLDFL